MDTELSALEEKVGYLVEFCHNLRTENHQLRQELAVALNENKQMSDKINAAKGRLETLLARIPENGL